MARLLADWEGMIVEIEVVPGKGGIFDVHIDGELAFTKAMLGHYPEPDEIAPILAEYFAAT